MSRRARSSASRDATAHMADDSPDTPTVWKDTKHEHLAPRLDIEEPEDSEKGERKSVDWMDFERRDGGPTRNMVNDGIQEEESQR